MRSPKKNRSKAKLAKKKPKKIRFLKKRPAVRKKIKKKIIRRKPPAIKAYESKQLFSKKAQKENEIFRAAQRFYKLNFPEPLLAAKKAVEKFKPHKRQLGRFVFIDPKGKEIIRGRRENYLRIKGYMVYVDKIGRKKLINQHKNRAGQARKMVKIIYETTSFYFIIFIYSNPSYSGIGIIS